VNNKLTDPTRSVVLFFLKVTLGLLCRIKSEGINNIPINGPLIIYSNHSGELEIPIMYMVVQPRIVTGMAKIESWDNPLLRWLFNLFEFIPVRRGELDLEAFKKTIDRLGEGYIVGISPEGTRSRDGKLIKARPGIVTLALRSGAMLLPVAHWGGEEFIDNLKNLRRTEFNIRVGEPFFLKLEETKLSKEVRQTIVDEMMYELAALLPKDYQGYYQNPEERPYLYLNKKVNLEVD